MHFLIELKSRDKRRGYSVLTVVTRQDTFWMNKISKYIPCSADKFLRCPRSLTLHLHGKSNGYHINETITLFLGQNTCVIDRCFHMYQIIDQ